MLHDEVSATRLAAERALNARLGGKCQVPVAGHAVVEGTRVTLQAMVGAPDGSRMVRGHIAGEASAAASLGETLAERLLGQGAREILAGLGIQA